MSSKHLSFLETGRAKPSRDMVDRLSEALRLPLNARNQMLCFAGFAARYVPRDWDDAAMEPVRRAVAWQLERHLPFPGLAVDRLWVIRQANRAATRLFGAFGVGPGDSLLELMQSSVLPEVIENWPEVAHQALVRLRTETAVYGPHPAVAKAQSYLSGFARSQRPGATPVIPTIVRYEGARLSMFATLSHFSTPDDLLLDDLKVELYFPMDEATADVFRAWNE